MKPIVKSNKLANVAYDIRGPVLEKARQMEEEGHKIIKLNIGNVAAFGLEPPDEIVQDMIRNLPHAAGYTDSKGLFAPRKAVVHYTQQKNVKGVSIDDVYLGNGASELIGIGMNQRLSPQPPDRGGGDRSPAATGRYVGIRNFATFWGKFVWPATCARANCGPANGRLHRIHPRRRLPELRP